MSFVDKVTAWLHHLPHFNYKFQRINDSFNIDVNGSYIQSLVVFCGLSLLLALLFLLGIVITWICQCCFKKTEHVRSQRNIRRLSTTLFLLSVVCFILLGSCLYGNEHTNKSVTASGTALADFNQNIRISIQQVIKLENIQTNAARHVEELTAIIEQKSKEVPGINQTQLREADVILTELSDKIDDVKKQLSSVSQIFSDIKFLDRFQHYGTRIEFERWILCVTLLSIMIAVLFAGVIAFCRQSRKGAIIFSGLGIVIFLVTWLLFSLVFSITVAYADFCYDSRQFLRSKINDAIIETFEFYHTCTPSSTHDNLPTTIPIAEINNFYKKIEDNQQKLEVLLFALFNRSEEIENVTKEISSDITDSFKSIGAFELTLSCYNIHNDANVMYNGFCTHGFLGSAIVAASLFLLGVFLFILLILVSKSWYIFVRLPTDYVEVGDDDHFSPRGQDAMPENVYDTNVFNPRARQFGGIVDTNGSILNGITESIGNGHTNHLNLNATSSPLLMNGGNIGGMDSAPTSTLTGTWLRNNGNLASAPPATNTITSQQRNSGNYYRLSNNNPYRSHYHQPGTEFQEQFDI